MNPKLIAAALAVSLSGCAQVTSGINSLTSALAPRLAASGGFFILPRNLYPPIEQGAVVLKHISQRANAQKLLAFLLSAPVQAQLAQSGLTPVHS